MNNLDQHPLMKYISTMPRTMWGSLEGRIGITTESGQLNEPSKLRLHICLNGIHQGREAVVASSSLYGEGGLEIHPTIADELRIKEIEALSGTPEEFLDKVFMSDGFKFLSRTAGVMFTRNIRTFKDRSKP